MAWRKINYWIFALLKRSYFNSEFCPSRFKFIYKIAFVYEF